MRLSPSPVRFDIIPRERVSGVSEIVGHSAGVTQNCLVWGTAPRIYGVRSLASVVAV